MLTVFVYRLVSDLFTPILIMNDIQEPEAAPRANPTPTPAPVPVASTSTATAPAAGSAPAQSEPSEGHRADAVKRTRSVVAISQIARTFESLKRDFTFPAGPLAPLPGSEAPRLAYNSATAPIHAYEHALSELLTNLDGVESFGFRGVRELRKEVVVKIEKELEALEKKVAEAIAAGASPVIKSTEVIPEGPATENQATVKNKVTEDIVMEEAEVAAIVTPEETAEGYELDTDDAATIVPAFVADSAMADLEAQIITIEVTEPVSDAPAFVLTPVAPEAQSASVEPPLAQPKEDAIEPESKEIDSDPIVTEPAVGRNAERALQITESITPTAVVPREVVATPTPEPPSQTVILDAIASSSESESEIEDAVDVTLSSDSDVDVTLEADEAASDAEKDFEML